MNKKQLIVACPNKSCKQKLRLPKTEKKILITCPICHTEFHYWHLNWYHRGWFIILTLLFVTPIGLIILWTSPRFQTRAKIGLTICFSLIFLNSTMRNFYMQRFEDLYDMLYLSEQDLLSKETYLPKFSKISSNLISSLQLYSYENTVEISREKIIEMAKKAVTLITVFDKNKEEIAKGTGFFISNDGYIVTNYHLISGASTVEIKCDDGRVFKEVFLVLKDNKRDIALLKIDGMISSFLILGDSDRVKEGEDVLVIGNPLGYFTRTVSNGIVSAIRYSEEIKYIQITAPVSSGSSGSPLINKNGLVIGIVTSNVPPLLGQNLNFAIPINYIKELVTKHIRNE